MWSIKLLMSLLIIVCTVTAHAEISNQTIKDITEAITRICATPTQTGFRKLVEVEGSVGGFIVKLVGIRGGIKFSKEEWEGIKQTVYTGNSIECGVKLTPIFIDRFTKAIPTSGIIVSDGLAAYYPFNGDAQNEGPDKEESYDGKKIHRATLTQDRFRVARSAYYFDGKSYIDMGNVLNQSKNSFTYSLWIKPTNLSGEHHLMGKAEIGISGVALTILEANEFRFFMGEYPIKKVERDIYWDTKGIELRSTKWYHIAVTVDRFKNKAHIYIDGIKSEGPYLSEGDFNKDTNIYNSRNLMIGAGKRKGYGDDPRTGFIGSIDDIRIYDRPLTEPEVKRLSDDRPRR